jgi:hypothetical protein
MHKVGNKAIEKCLSILNGTVEYEIDSFNPRQSLKGAAVFVEVFIFRISKNPNCLYIVDVDGESAQVGAEEFNEPTYKSGD